MLGFSNAGFNSMYPSQNSMYPSQNSMYPSQNSMYPTQNYCNSVNVTNIINNYYQVVQSQPTMCYAQAPVQQNCFQTANYSNQYAMNQYQPVNTFMSCNNYGYQQQNNVNINSLFGSLFNQGTNQQQVCNNNSPQNFLLTLFQMLLGIQTKVAQPTIDENVEQLYSLFENLFEGTAFEDIFESDLEVYNENVTVQATGDPHFAVNGQQAFDFQGKNDSIYKMHDNKDISLNAKFAGGGEGAATIILDQNLAFKDSNINIVSHANGNFEILQNGEKIADQTNYNTDKKVIDLLKANDITITKKGEILTTKHAGRTLEQKLNGGNIDNTNETLMKGDKGLLTQGIGAIDDDKDGTTKMSVDVKKDGVLDDKDTLTYSAKDQFMVHTEVQGTSCKTITPEIEAAIKKDVEAGAKLGSVAKGFSVEHGYDARQWNEYIGAKLYTIKEDALLTA